MNNKTKQPLNDFFAETAQLVTVMVIIGLMFAWYSNKQTSSIKTELFQLRTAINANSCFHLELPPSDNHESKRAKGNSKTNTGRNKANKSKAGAVPKRKP